MKIQMNNGIVLERKPRLKNEVVSVSDETGKLAIGMGWARLPDEAPVELSTEDLENKAIETTEKKVRKPRKKKG